MKEINAIKTQLMVTIGTNLFQHWVQKNSKLNKTELTSLLTVTTMKMNQKYYCKDEKLRVNGKKESLQLMFLGVNNV